MDGQAGLRLCCSQPIEDRISRVEAHIIVLIIHTQNVSNLTNGARDMILVIWKDVCTDNVKNYIPQLSASQRDDSFEHPKHMLKLLGKKIFTVLH